MARITKHLLVKSGWHRCTKCGRSSEGTRCDRCPQDDVVVRAERIVADAAYPILVGPTGLYHPLRDDPPQPSTWTQLGHTAERED